MVRAQANGHHRVCLQIDSLLAYKWLKTNEDYPMEFSNLILDCRWLLNRDWEVHVDHIWREANSCADLLTKKGISQSESEVLYDTCPTFLWQFLYWDSMGFVLVIKDPVVFCLVSAIPLFVWCCLDCVQFASVQFVWFVC